MKIGSNRMMIVLTAMSGLCEGMSMNPPGMEALPAPPARRRGGFVYRNSFRHRCSSLPFEGGYWNGDGVPVTTVTRQMRRLAARKEPKR